MLRNFTHKRMVECEGNYAAAEHWISKMEERGVEMDGERTIHRHG